MKFALTILSLLTLSLTVFAGPITEISVGDVSLNANGDFVDCTLTDGRALSATIWLVIVGDEILSKDAVRAYTSPTAEHIEYKNWNNTVIAVSKQFSGREGLQGISIVHTDNPSKNENYLCKEKVGMKD